jgi:hypothetical protein
MSRLNGELYLSQLTIPSTHNTHALKGTVEMPNNNSVVPGATFVDEVANIIAKARKAAECQDIDIRSQLENGIRYLDFRYGKDLRMRHGQLKLPGTLGECVKVVADFLASHPNETVIVMAKWDVWDFITDAGHDEPDETREAANKVFKDLGCFWDFTTIPKLQECRGKILRKREGAGANHGLDFDKIKRDDKYKQPDFTWPPYKIEPLLDAKQNEWAETMWRIKGSWARAEASLNWIKSVQPQAKQPNVWDNTGLNDTEINFATVFSGTSIFPVDFASNNNQELLTGYSKIVRWLNSTSLGSFSLIFASAKAKTFSAS